MRTKLSIIALVMGLVLFGLTSNSVAATAPQPRCGAAEFIAKVWNTDRWSTVPKDSTLEAWRQKLRCSSPLSRAELKTEWRAAKTAFYQFRHQEGFRVRVTPFYCNGEWWATECEIPLHESGYGSGGSNLYGMKDAWYEHGCTEFAPSAWDASKHDQDICAHRHWVRYGRYGWPSY